MKTFGSLLTLFIFSFLLAPSLWANGCLDAIVSKDAGSNIVYAFRGDEVSTYSWSDDSFGPPVHLWGLFPNLPYDHVDAAFETPAALWLISGDKMTRVNKDDFSDNSTQSLSTYFPAFPDYWTSGIDAAVCKLASNSIANLYLFKGNQSVWIEIDPNTGLGSGLIQLPYSFDWDGLLTEHYPDGIDAALHYASAPGYFFQKGNSFVRLDFDNLEIPPGYPTSYTSSWGNGNFPDGWSCINNFNNGDCDVNYLLPDVGCGDASSVEFEVTDAPGTALGSDVSLSAVELYIQHSFVSNLVVSLVSPSGQEVFLLFTEGGSGTDFGSSCNMPTVFSMSASNSISSGSPPFVGTFLPFGDFADLNDGTSPNGVWELKICDVSNLVIGTFQYVELQFETMTSTNNILASDLGFKTHPNPAGSSMQVTYEHTGSQPWSLEIYNLMGQQVDQLAVDGSTTISVADWTNGLYFCNLLDENNNLIITQRCVVAH